jgi:DNA-binding response OmpR family regulator
MADPFRKGKVSTLLLGEPGVRRDSICALLNAIPNIQVNHIINPTEKDLGLPKSQDLSCLIIDGSQEDPIQETLDWITEVKKENPQILVMVFSASAKHTTTYNQAGADLVLERGFSLSELSLSLQALFEKNDIDLVK